MNNMIRLILKISTINTKKKTEYGRDDIRYHHYTYSVYLLYMPIVQFMKQ